MNASVIVGLSFTTLAAILLWAGFDSGNIPNNITGLNADRNTAPLAFWLWACIYILLALFGLAITFVNWGK